MTKLVLLRHGQSTWNLAGRLQGQRHEPELTAAGLEQAEVAAREIATLVAPGTPVFASDLRRAAQTAELVAARLGSQLHLDPRLREQGLGELEGSYTDQLVELPTPAGQHINEVRWAGGESIADVHRRSLEFLANLPGELPAAVIVGHGISLAVLAAAAAGQSHREIDFAEPWANAAWTCIRWAGDQALRPNGDPR